MPSHAATQAIIKSEQKRKRKFYALRRHHGSLCAQKQPGKVRARRLPPLLMYPSSGSVYRYRYRCTRKPGHDDSSNCAAQRPLDVTLHYVHVYERVHKLHRRRENVDISNSRIASGGWQGLTRICQDHMLGIPGKCNSQACTVNLVCHLSCSSQHKMAHSVLPSNMTHHHNHHESTCQVTENPLGNYTIKQMPSVVLLRTKCKLEQLHTAWQALLIVIILERDRAHGVICQVFIPRTCRNGSSIHLHIGPTCCTIWVGQILDDTSANRCSWWLPHCMSWSSCNMIVAFRLKLSKHDGRQAGSDSCLILNAAACALCINDVIILHVKLSTQLACTDGLRKWHLCWCGWSWQCSPLLP